MCKWEKRSFQEKNSGSDFASEFFSRKTSIRIILLLLFQKKFQNCSDCIQIFVSLHLKYRHFFCHCYMWNREKNLGENFLIFHVSKDLGEKHKTVFCLFVFLHFFSRIFFQILFLCETRWTKKLSGDFFFFFKVEWSIKWHKDSFCLCLTHLDVTSREDMSSSLLSNPAKHSSSQASDIQTLGPLD